MVEQQIRLGIDLGGTKIEALAIDQHGIEMWRQRVPTPKDDYQSTLSTIADLVHQAEAHLKSFVTVGVGTPGAISTKTGRMKNCNSVWLNGQPLVDDLSRLLKREIKQANDADCFVLSEATDGAARDADLVFGIIIGTGTGGGICFKKQILNGPNRITGEWGHNPMPLESQEDREKRSCYCGKAGCIETYLSGPALEQEFKRQTGLELSGQEIKSKLLQERSAAQAGNKETEQSHHTATEIVDQYCRWLAVATAGVINILDPDVIVLGGGVSNIPMIYERVPKYWPGLVFSDEVLTRLVPAQYGDASGVRGAAWLWNSQ